MTPPSAAAIAEVIDIFTRPAPTPDPRAGELVERYLASLDRYIEETLPTEDASLDELLQRLRP